MSANDHLAKDQFFHGTISPLQPDDVIEPVAKSTWRKVRFPHDTDPEYAYATSDVDTAWHYAEKVWGSTDSPTHPKVFEVEPVGEHEEDPTRDAHGQLRGNFSTDRRSKHGWRVLREVPMPEHMGTPEEWR